ncbi:hypothetical protein A2W24_05595 [Microgenomates group bacterium RBG_16_45_19]|nr:MAG: hypothetical protein A2W24_05595 [Microgenomates group bacterium RBG_16_45_19]
MTRTALVTGSSRGIGQAIALAFAQGGYRVIVHGSKPSLKLDHTTTTVRSLSPESFSYPFNLADELAVTQACQLLLKKVGAIDVLVNNAAITRDQIFLRLTPAQWDTVIKTNLYGPFYVLKIVLPAMVKRRWGRIINLTSIAAKRGAYGKTNYAAAKAGLIALTQSLAYEVGRYGITVNAICPAWVKTDMSLSIPKKYRDQALSQVALQRMATPKEIADLASFLASDHSAYINGAVLDINGGLS